MRKTGALDYLELSCGDTPVETVKAFYRSAFAWSFVDYGPRYAAFSEGLDGGLDGGDGRPRAPLPIVYAEDIEAALRSVEAAGGRIVQPIFAFPGGRRFHFADPAGNELAVWSDKDAAPQAG